MLNNIFKSRQEELPTFPSIEVKTSKSNKVTLFLSDSTRPKIINIQGMTVPQIQQAFRIGNYYGSKIIEAVTIE